MKTLGISAYYHDSAAALVEDGEIIAAAQEERFSRLKHDARFPAQAIGYCLDAAGVKLGELDQIVFFEKPFIKFERLLETYVQTAPRGFRSFAMAMPLWIKEKLFQKSELKKALRDLDRGDLPSDPLFSEHHLSHAASAFYPSPFDEALILTMDGVGEWATTTVAVGSGRDLNIHREIHFPHSLGLLYSAVTYYTGFRVNSGEYKVMGLAPYGEPRFAQRMFEHLIDLKDDGSFRLNQAYFNYATGLTMTNAAFSELFGQPVRSAESRLDPFHMDMAASVQVVVEEAVLRLARDQAKRTGLRSLCLAGGVALNCVANGKLRRAGLFDNIWVQPAAGDAGGSLGAALYAQHAYAKVPRTRSASDSMKGAYLGPEHAQADIEGALDSAGAVYESLDTDGLVGKVASDLAEGAAVGWFQGRMEFGPRALGNRSILGDPRNPKTQETLNLKIKFRESFRPFAPAILEEKVEEWFDFDEPSPYMLMVDQVASSRKRDVDETRQGLDRLKEIRSEIPAVTHVDGSARIQTVSARTNPLFHALISEFDRRTGCPVIVNTSFNIRGEPIVCTPEDAFRCFMGTNMDVLVVGNCYLHKEDQSTDLLQDYRDQFSLD